MANPFQLITPDAVSARDSILTSEEQQGFGSYAIFGEQPLYYSEPEIWRIGYSNVGTAGSGAATLYYSNDYLPPTTAKSDIPEGWTSTKGENTYVIAARASGTTLTETTIPMRVETETIKTGITIEIIYHATETEADDDWGTTAASNFAVRIRRNAYSNVRTAGSGAATLYYSDSDKVPTSATSGTPNGWSSTKGTNKYVIAARTSGSNITATTIPIKVASLAGTTEQVVYHATETEAADDWTTTAASNFAIRIPVLLPTRIQTEKMYPAVFEFTSSGIVNESTPITPERISPTRSPIKNQDGQVMVSGDFAMHVHVEDMMLFWKYILHDNEPTCTDITSRIPDNQKAAVSSSGNLVPSGSGTELKFYETKFINRNRTLPGLTAEIRKGRTANVYTGLNISSASLSFAENIDITLTMMGYRGYLRQGLERASDSVVISRDDTKEEIEERARGTAYFAFENERNLSNIYKYKALDQRGKTTDKPSVAGSFKLLEEDTYKGWGCAVRLYNDDDIEGLSGDALTRAKNENIVPVTDVTLNINHNLEHTPRYWGWRFARRPVPTAKREITLDCTTDYTIEDTFAQDFFENRVWDHAELLIVHQFYYEEGKQLTYQTIIGLGRGQLTTYSDPEVADQGPLTQTINFKALPATAGSSDELDVQIISPENLSFIVKNRTELDKDPADRTAGALNGTGTGFLDATTS